MENTNHLRKGNEQPEISVSCYDRLSLGEERRIQNPTSRGQLPRKDIIIDVYKVETVDDRPKFSKISRSTLSVQEETIEIIVTRSYCAVSKKETPVHVKNAKNPLLPLNDSYAVK